MLIQLFVDNILPSFIIVGLGAALARSLKLDVRSISRIALYVLTPALVFSSLVKTRVSGQDMAGMIAFLLLITTLTGMLGYGVGRAIGLDRVRLNALMLATMFANAGNLGLSVLLFAYGQDGMDRGLLYFVGSALLNHTLGAFLASRGRCTVRQSFMNTLRLPALYAVALALLLRAANIPVPDFVLDPMSLVGGAAVPVLLLVLGMQLAHTRLQGNAMLVGIAVFIKLFAVAAIAFILARLLGLDGLTRQVSIVEASTPTAVTVIMMAIEFDADPRFVTSVVFLSTLLSAATLTVILGLVR